MSDKQTTPKMTATRWQWHMDNILENIAWWTGQRDDHMAKSQYIAAQKCQEEIDLWKQELEDLK